MHTISYTYKIDESLNVQHIAPENMLISGDADNNGVLNAADSAFVLQKALVSTFSLPIEELPYENLILKDGIAVSGHKEIIDVNKNGIIDAADAAQILQTVLDPEYTTS